MLSQGHDRSLDLLPFGAHRAVAVIRGALQVQSSTSFSRRTFALFHHMLDRPPLLRRAYHFFEFTSFRIEICTAWSATMFFSAGSHPPKRAIGALRPHPSRRILPFQPLRSRTDVVTGAHCFDRCPLRLAKDPNNLLFTESASSLLLLLSSRSRTPTMSRPLFGSQVIQARPQRGVRDFRLSKLF